MFREAAVNFFSDSPHHGERALALAAAMLLVGGCKSNGASTQTAADPAVQATTTQPGVADENHWPTPSKQVEPAPKTERPMVAGNLPLVYLADLACPVRVVDLTSGLTLAEGNVPARSIVRVQKDTGVHLGKENLLPGPLDESHEYGIFVDPGGKIGYDSSVIQTPRTPRKKK